MTYGFNDNSNGNRETENRRERKKNVFKKSEQEKLPTRVSMTILIRAIESCFQQSSDICTTLIAFFMVFFPFVYFFLRSSFFYTFSNRLHKAKQATSTNFGPPFRRIFAFNI